MNPVDIQVFMNDPQVQEVIAATKNPPASTPKVNIDPDSEDYSNLTAGDGTISGLTSGKYYMVEESNGDGVLTRTRFIKADGDNGATLDEIGLLEGTQITNLKNSFTYKITSAKPFDESATYEYFTFGDASSIKLANVSPNGGITTVAVIGTGSYCLDLKAVIKANKLYEVMMVSGTWTASRTSARYNSTPGENIGVIGTSYNDKYNSNKDIGVYQYDNINLYTGGLNTGINLKDRSIVAELPAMGDTKDYVFAEWSGKYTTPQNAVTKFTFLRVVRSETSLPLFNGSVKITGTPPVVGQPLTADISELTNATGTISYQWKRGATNVGTNSSTYTPENADVGSTITVTVTSTGNLGSVTSAATVAVTYPPLTGTVTITNGNTAVVGEILTANISALNGTGTPSYQWKRGSTNIGTNSVTYTLVAGDVGSKITVEVTRDGYDGVIIGGPTETVTNPGDPPLTGTVTITNGNTAVVGEILTANISALNGTGTPSYQWKREGANIGTNSATYTLVAGDVGSTITVEVTRAGYSGSITGGPTATVVKPTLTGTVTITNGNTAVVGEILTANISALNGTGTPSYQWKRGVTNIGTDATYTLVAGDVGSTITVEVTRDGYDGIITGGPTATVVKPTLTGTVTITNGNTAVVGEILTANISALNGTGTPSYQWKRGVTNIGTNATYTLVAGDVGSTITVEVSRDGYDGVITGGPTATVVKPTLTGTVTITNGNTAEVGQTLTAVTSALSGTGTLSYQWKRGSTEIGTDSATYTLVAGDAGSKITVEVTRDGYDGVVIGGPTETVTNPSDPALTGTVSISGIAVVGQTLTANISALNGTGTPSYQWKRDDENITGATSGTYTLVNLDKGRKITVTVTRFGNSGSVTSIPTATVTAPKIVLDFNGIKLTWISGPTGTPDIDTGSKATYDGNKLDLVLKVTGLTASSYSWYYGNDTLPFASGANVTKYFSVYSGVNGYEEDVRWFQDGKHTITLITDTDTGKGIYQFTFTYTQP